MKCSFGVAGGGGAWLAVAQLVFIGQDLDATGLRAAMDAALVTPAELEHYHSQLRGYVSERERGSYHSQLRGYVSERERGSYHSQLRGYVSERERGSYHSQLRGYVSERARGSYHQHALKDSPVISGVNSTPTAATCGGARVVRARRLD
jgi:hypothetical protein